MSRFLLDDDCATELEALRAANDAFAAKYPGEGSERGGRPRRQPVHTFYGGAQFYAASATRELGERALRAMERHGRDPADFARALGWADVDPALAATVYSRVRAKLRREPVEDYRIDFEDGFGTRPDDEEDRAAVTAAHQLGRSMADGTAPPFTGIRIKSLGPEGTRRAARTLELFVGALLEERDGVMPEGFVVTLPKVNVPEQPATLVRWLERLETRHGLAPGTLRFEIMVETTQAFMGADGRSPLPSFLDACEGRCTGVHLGVYDFTASCEVSPLHQSMAHPMCELARNSMRLAYGCRGVFLSDGGTHVLPVGPHAGEELTETQHAENRQAVHHAWRLSSAHIRHSLEGAFYQGWDLHPAQLPVRFATCFAFFLEGFAPAAARLRAFVARAATTQIADEPATARALLSYVQRALACGAVDAEDLVATGLTLDEVAMRSVGDILASRASG